MGRVGAHLQRARAHLAANPCGGGPDRRRLTEGALRKARQRQGARERSTRAAEKRDRAMCRAAAAADTGGASEGHTCHADAPIALPMLTAAAPIAGG